MMTNSAKDGPACSALAFMCCHLVGLCAEPEEIVAQLCLFSESAIIASPRARGSSASGHCQAGLPKQIQSRTHTTPALQMTNCVALDVDFAWVWGRLADHRLHHNPGRELLTGILRSPSLWGPKDGDLSRGSGLVQLRAKPVPGYPDNNCCKATLATNPPRRAA
jgi:hypothetical protein